MVGTHNTMTYMRAKCRAWELLSGWWRCQRRSFDEQIAHGVRYFDLRLRRYDGAWYWAHGLVLLEEARLADVLDRISECGGTCRIMLEAGDREDEEVFVQSFEQKSLRKVYPCVTACIIKKGWRVVWRSPKDMPVYDCTWVPYHRGIPWWKQLRTIICFPFQTIEGWARRHKKPGIDEWSRQGVVWYYDFI